MGQVIRDARNAAGLPSKELAARVGISPAAMSLIESGQREVKAREVNEFARALGISPLMLLDPDSPAKSLTAAARTVADVTSTSSAVMNRLNQIIDLRLALGDHGTASAAHWAGIPEADTGQWLKSAQELGYWARGVLGELEPGASRFASLARALNRHLEIDVLVERFDDDVIGAAIVGRAFPTIIVNAGQRRQRALFTLAHELGHVLADDGDKISLERDLRATSPSERLANAFASEFLLPKDEVFELAAQSENRVSETAARLMDRCDVSYETSIYRLHNLGLINASQRDHMKSVPRSSLIDSLQDEELKSELISRSNSLGERVVLPTRLLLVLLDAFNDGKVSANPIASILGVDPKEVVDGFRQPGRPKVDIGQEQLQTEPDEVASPASYDAAPA